MVSVIGVGALVVNDFVSDANRRVIDHRHDGDRHVGAHHVGVGHPQKQHEGHEVPRTPPSWKKGKGQC